MALSPGDKLGPYEILTLIGPGGMGEVYRARDARLQRDVAVKALPRAFATPAAREDSSVKHLGEAGDGYFLQHDSQVVPAWYICAHGTKNLLNGYTPSYWDCWSSVRTNSASFPYAH